MSSASSLLAALRRATEADHQAIDRRLTPAGGWTLARYIDLLQVTLAVVGPLEPKIGALLPAFGAHPSRSDALRSDLEAVNAGPSAARPALPEIGTLAQAYGAAYVLQGSMLGGAVIKRAISTDVPSARTAYLDFHGASLGQTWRHFLAELDRFGAAAGAAAWDDAAGAARGTFAAFDAALTELTCDKA